jgi:hypothetical protein
MNDGRGHIAAAVPVYGSIPVASGFSRTLASRGSNPWLAGLIAQRPQLQIPRNQLSRHEKVDRPRLVGSHADLYKTWT